MDDTKLFDGVGMIIDDHVLSTGDDKIVKIVDFLENTKGLPLIKYTSLPEISDTNTLMGIKFILLDWDLNDLSIGEDELPLGISQLQDKNTNDNIDFLKKVIDTLVVPIFIFSHRSEDEIMRYLMKGKLIDKDNSNKASIFVKSKSDLFDENNQCIIFDVAKEWLQSTPAIYLIQKWKMEYLHAINTMALDMKGASASWPNILWKCYEDDGVNPSEEIVSVINQNVLSRIQPIEFDERVLGKELDCDLDSLKNVLSKNCFIENTNLGEFSSTGDIYYNKKVYYINIRPMCDCVNRKGKGIDEIYLLRGDKLSNSNIHDRFVPKYGHFNEQSNTAIVGPIEGKFIEFRFKELQICDYANWKDKRIGRVIPPYITHITQKYGLYVHRQGLPRVPKEIVPNMKENEELNSEVDELKNQLSQGKKQIENLTKVVAEMQKRVKAKQSVCRWQNCRVIITPSLKKRKFRK